MQKCKTIVHRNRKYELRLVSLEFSSLTDLYLQNYSLFCGAKRATSIQYSYRKCETQAHVLFQTLAHGNSNNEIR